MLKFDKKGSTDTLYSIGDRRGQLMMLPLPSIHFFEVDDLSSTARDSKGFGSSGR